MTENQTPHYSEWRRIANLRQGVINKLDKKVLRLESKIRTLTTSLDAANARLAMYDQREGS